MRERHESTPKSGRLRPLLARVAILASALGLMLFSEWGNSVTVVEFVQLPASLAACQEHSLGLYRVCGPVSKYLYGWPLRLAGIRVAYSTKSPADVVVYHDVTVGKSFQSHYQKQYFTIYRFTRMVTICITLACGCLLCEWSTLLFGTKGGMISLCAWCWMPPILAHGALVTSDMPSAMMMLVSARLFWSFLLKPRPATALITGFALGASAATKFTLLVLYPCWFLLLIGRVIEQLRRKQVETATPNQSVSPLIGGGLLIFAVSVLTLNGFYVFQGVGCRLSELSPGESSLGRILQPLEATPATSWLFHAPLPLPREFLRGLDAQLSDTERSQSAYLLGLTRLGGWWYWYIAASLFKLPLPVLGLFVLSLFRLPAAFQSGGPIAWAGLCSLFPAAEVVLAISASTGTGSNAAFRYLIPGIVLGCFWCGEVGRTKRSQVRIFILFLFLWLAGNAVTSLPDPLGWQNELGMAWSALTGRPTLIGDSTDWGQDHARLYKWLRAHSQEGETIGYVHGSGSLEPYGLGRPYLVLHSESWEKAKYVAISVNLLYNYQSQRAATIDGRLSSLSEDQREWLLRRKPFAKVGHAIWIFKIDPSETITVGGRIRGSCQRVGGG